MARFANASVEKEEARAEARGDVKSNSFSGAIRNTDMQPLMKGDVFPIPEEFTVFSSKQFNGAQYIFVTTDKERVVQFFPSTLTKAVQEYDSNLKMTGNRVVAKGSAVELFTQFADVNEGMNALKGKKIKVSDIIEVQTVRYNSERLRTAQVPVLDIVE